MCALGHIESFRVEEATAADDQQPLSRRERRLHQDLGYVAGLGAVVVILALSVGCAVKQMTSVMVGCPVMQGVVEIRLELDHDILWRTTCRLPERGRIGIFNRSQYEEVLVARVHPQILKAQNLPDEIDFDSVWDDRLRSICEQEHHLARNGTVILKFWLNVSKDVQKRRFLARLDDPSKNWKFDTGDVVERRYWDDYMHAYECALNATSRPWAPWYAIPADKKPYMQARVAGIIIQALQKIGLEYPEPSAKDRAEFAKARKELS